MNIRKRNGEEVPFNKDKMVVAINKAFIEVDGSIKNPKIATDIADKIYDYAVSANRCLDVEEIQDKVEDALMMSGRKDVAKTYIRYRYKKEVARNYSNDFIDAIKEKLSGRNVQNQNANVDERSFGGRTGEAIDVVTKQLALDFVVSPKAKQRHLDNEIYIHDLGSYFVGNHNCLTMPFDDLLANGFTTRQTDVRPANSVNTAFQLIAVLFQLQSLSQFGRTSSAC